MTTTTKPTKASPAEALAKPGYKHTKLGWIPEEWEVQLLDEIAQRGSGHTPNRKTPEYHNGGIKWISLIDSSRLDQGVINETEFEVSQLGLQNSSAVLHPKGTVVISRDAYVGKSAVMGCDMAVSQHFMTWTCDQRLVNWFLYYTLQHRKQEFERIAVGSTIKTIGLPYFKRLQVIYPPLPEQRRIALVLGAWDRAIATVQLLLAAQQERKRGLMQELLTGKRRFPGFEGKWKEVRLGDVFEFLRTTSYSREQLTYDPAEGSVANIHYGDIHATYASPTLDVSNNTLVPRLRHSVALPQKVTYLQDGDLIIADASEDQEGVGASIELTNVGDLKVISGLHTIALRDMHGATVPGYRAYMLREHDLANRLRTIATGSKVHSISKTNIMEVTLRLPPREEQQRIVAMLTSADDHISHLKDQLTHLTTQKRGLMQVLLTGEKRLIDQKVR